MAASTSDQAKPQSGRARALHEHVHVSGGVTYRATNGDAANNAALMSDRTSVLDLDILDLDAMLTNENDYWLTGAGAGATNERPPQSDDDIIDWLKRAAEGLEPRKRHSLALKLEAIGKKRALWWQFRRLFYQGRQMRKHARRPWS